MVSADTQRLCRHDAAEGDDRDLTGAAPHIYHHAAFGLMHIKPCADSYNFV